MKASDTVESHEADHYMKVLEARKNKGAI